MGGVDGGQICMVGQDTNSGIRSRDSNLDSITSILPFKNHIESLVGAKPCSKHWRHNGELDIQSACLPEITRMRQTHKCS